MRIPSATASSVASRIARPACWHCSSSVCARRRGRREDHRHRVRDVLALERRCRAVRRLGHQRGRSVDAVVAERDEQRLGAGDRAEQRQHEVGEDVAVAVERGDHHRRAARGDQEGERRVDQLRLVRDIRMARRGRVHLLLEHALVDGAHRVLRAAEHLRAGSLGLTERELRDGAADPTLDALGAKGDLGVAGALAPLLRAVRVADGHAHDGDRRVDAADGEDTRDPSPGADDHLAADVLAEDPVRRPDIVTTLRGHRRGLESEPVRRDRARRLVHDLVRRLASLPEREVEPRQRELEPEHLVLQDAKGGLEQLLPGLVSFENDDRVARPPKPHSTCRIVPDLRCGSTRTGVMTRV